MALSLDKLVSNLYDTSKIHCDKWKGVMELVNTCKWWHAYQSCHEKRRFDVSFSGPPTLVRNIAPWQTLADKVKK